MQSVAVGDSRTNLNATNEEHTYTDHSNEYRDQARNSVQPILSIQKMDDGERPHPFCKTQMSMGNADDGRMGQDKEGSKNAVTDSESPNAPVQ